MSDKSKETTRKYSDVGIKDETKHSTSQSERSLFDPNVITEADIEKIWAKMKNISVQERKYRKKKELNLASTETTPTTDYDDIYFPMHQETLDEELVLEKKKSKMEEVLRSKKAKPKTYLTQVILYDNISHQRLLDQKLKQLKNRHQIVERKMKRKKEIFLHNLESKQNEWTRLDARVTKKFEPEKMPDLTFKFGQLYHSANYPYQAAINTLRGIQPQKHMSSRKLRILPQVTHRKERRDSEPSESGSGSSRVFITRLRKNNRRNNDNFVQNEDVDPETLEREPWRRTNIAVPLTIDETMRPTARVGLPPVRGKKLSTDKKNWMNDSRYVTLTSILGERCSPKKKFRTANVA